MIVIFIIAFMCNILAAGAIKDLTEDTDPYWVKSKLVRVILLIPPISIAILMIGWVLGAIEIMIDRIKDYLD